MLYLLTTISNGDFSPTSALDQKLGIMEGLEDQFLYCHYHGHLSCQIPVLK